jgi:hypothetical protein
MTSAPVAVTPALAQYVRDATELISTRVAELADTAVRHRPPMDAVPRPVTR